MTRSKHMTQEELNVLIARSLKPMETEDEPESKLQSDIKTYCKVAGWPILSFPMTKAVRNFLPPGWWDITIKIPRGITLDIETKKFKTGRLSDKQKLLKNMCAQLGHKIHKIDTWKQFLELIDEKTKKV